MLNFWLLKIVSISFGFVLAFLIASYVFLNREYLLYLKKRKQEHFLEWWKHLSVLKKIYFGLTVFVSPVFIGSFIFIFPYFIIKIYNGNAPFSELALALFAIISGLGALFGFYTSIINTETTEQGHITDRINKAIENLGKNDGNSVAVREVRLGALLALERIAKDSLRDHIPIMEILYAYVRNNSPDMHTQNKPITPTEDIWAALNIIGRRNKWPNTRKRVEQEVTQKSRFFLHDCYLSSAYLKNACLHGAIINYTNLRNAFIEKADLREVLFLSVDLNNAWMSLVNMDSIQFKDTDMEDVKTVGAYAHTGDFLGCKNFTQKQLDVMFLGKTVKLPPGLTHPQKGTEHDIIYNTSEVFFIAYKKWLEETYPDLARNFEK